MKRFTGVTEVLGWTMTLVEALVHVAKCESSDRKFAHEDQ